MTATAPEPRKKPLPPTIRLDNGHIIDTSDSQELTKAQLMAVLKQTQRRCAASVKKTRMAFKSKKLD